MTPRFSRGFTLIETMVAITIMTLAVLAPFAAVQQVVKATNMSKDQLIASFLAQEGMEYVRFVRYTNWLSSVAATGDVSDGAYNPIEGLDGNNGPDCTGTYKCTLDAREAPYDAGGDINGIAWCANPGHANCAPLYLTADGLYTQETADSSGTAYTRTPFTRSININDDNLDEGYITVTVTLTWNDHGARTMTLTEDMYDWLQ